MVKKISGEEFSEVKNAKVAVVDFSATWCGPCKMLAPVIHEIADEMEGKASFFNIDVDDDSDIAIDFQVQSVPTVIVFKNGEPAGLSIGFKPKAVMKSWIESFTK